MRGMHITKMYALGWQMPQSWIEAEETNVIGHLYMSSRVCSTLMCQIQTYTNCWTVIYVVNQQAMGTWGIRTMS